MKAEELVVKGPLSIVLAFLSYLSGMVSNLIFILLLIMGLDYVTGIMRGVLTRSLNSTIGLRGILKKIAMLMVIGLAACLEFVLITLDMKTHDAVVVTVTCFFIINESISVLENAAQLGVPIPKALYEALEKLRMITGKEKKVNYQKVRRTKNDGN